MEEFVRNDAAAVDLCKRLRRNDSNTTAITREHIWYAGYSSIGKALSGSTHVSSIYFDLHRLTANEGGQTNDQQARLMLKYIRESANLRALDVADDGHDISRFPHRRSANHDSRIVNLGTQVFQALWGNQDQASGSSLEELSFHQWYMTQSSEVALTRLLQESTSLRRLTIRVPSGSINIAWFGDALGSNESLEHLEVLELFGGPPIDYEAVCTILSSLVGHPRIQTLNFKSLDIVRAMLPALVDLLRRTRSLNALKGICFPQELTAEDATLFMTGLQSNQGSLKELSLGCVESDAFYVSFVAYLRSPAPSLPVLKLKFNGDRLDGVAESMVEPGSVGSALRCASSRRRDADPSLLLLLALSSRKVAKTSLKAYGSFRGIPIGPLVTYFQSEASLHNKLQVLGYYHYCLDGMAESMVQSGSVGSALRVFKTTGRRPDFAHFVNTMALQGSQNKLEGLHLDDLDDRDATALTNCLPSLVNLVELQVQGFNFGEDIKCDFLKALKKNGSLVKVSVEPELGHRYQRHVEAICERNEQMPLLLGRRPSGSDNVDGPDVTAEAEPATSSHAIAAAPTATITTRMKLFPSLFAAALESPQMTPHMMLLGLDTSADVIGFD